MIHSSQNYRRLIPFLLSLFLSLRLITHAIIMVSTSDNSARITLKKTTPSSNYFRIFITVLIQSYVTYEHGRPYHRANGVAALGVKSRKAPQCSIKSTN